MRNYIKFYLGILLSSFLHRGFVVTALPVNDPAHEIMVLFILRKLILQTRTRGHPVGLDV